MGKRVFAVAFRLAGAALMVLGATVFSSGIYAQSKAESKTSAGKTEKQVAPTPWNKVSSSERKVLTPLEKDWNQLPGIQQRRLIDSAKQYPKLAPIQQERFQERIKEWAALTPDQRKAAREKYRNLSSLPPAKQYELREKWSEKSRQPSLESAAAPTPAPAR